MNLDPFDQSDAERFAASYQGKSPDQVAFSELVAGLCFAVMVILLVGYAMLHRQPKPAAAIVPRPSATSTR